VARLVFPIALATAFLLAACGGGSGANEGQAPTADDMGAAETTGRPALPEWTRRLLAARGPDVALVFSTSDYVPGRNRVGFLIVRNDGSLVTAPTAAVYVGGERGGVTGRATARLETIGTGGKDVVGEATRLYVADVPLPSPGRHWLVIEPKGEAIQAVGAADVHARPAAPGVGDRAVPVHNPTLADAPATQITTAEPPDTALLRHSVADSLGRHDPFVVVFATPKFCQSRTCGPTVDVVDRVRRNLRGGGVRFIHIEIYKDNDPQKGVNQWVKAWHLPTEPWTFVVDRKGLIRARFEGSVGVRELEAAVRQSLL
jgi:hypothetical protein